MILAAGLRVSARPTLPTAVGPAFAYDDRSLSGCTTTMAKAVPTMPQSGSRSNRLAAFHVYDGIRRKVRNTVQKSSGKERDSETGLDYFLARYYSPAQGRFASPDEWAGGIVDPLTGGQVGQPGPLPYSDVTDPQTINKYAYVRNNPLRYTDPSGHCVDGLSTIACVLAGLGAAAIVESAWEFKNDLDGLDH
jgi:RHS repeat-associated protein